MKYMNKLFIVSASVALLLSACGTNEEGESVKDSVVREFREETGIYLKNPTVKGIFTFTMKENDQISSEWGRNC